MEVNTMKFTLSTKPLADALDLGVIPGNISKYYRLSCLAQLTATQKELRINLEASNVYTEILLKGSGDAEGPISALVDCLILKQLIGTLESSTTTLEYTEGAIIIHSGSSKFTLPFLADTFDGELKRPELAPEGATKVPVNLDDWKFIKDYQMYAVALSFVHPVYTNVWIGQSGDVIVGDFDNSLFTFSKKSKLGRTCLLPDTIINLFNSLPEGANITLMDKSYRVDVKTDGFEYAAQFTPKYEDEDNTGNYSADAIMSAVVKDTENSFKVAVAPIAKFLAQADLLSSGGTSKVEFSISGQEVRIQDENVDCRVKFEGKCNEFSIPVNSALLKPIIGHVDAETVTMCPAIVDGEVSGLTIWTDSLTVMVGAMDQGV